MPRKGHISKREVAPDPVYGSTLVTKFVNSMMWGGKKSTAQGIFYQAMKNMEEKGGGEEAIKLFKKAVENVKPLLEVKTRRVGGANSVSDAPALWPPIPILIPVVERSDGGVVDGGSGLVDALVVDEDAAGEDEGLGALAGGSEGAVDEEFVEAGFGCLLCLHCLVGLVQHLTRAGYRLGSGRSFAGFGQGSRLSGKSGGE